MTFKKCPPMPLVLPAVCICLFTLVTPNHAMNLNEAIGLALRYDAQLHADSYTAEARKAEGWQSVAAYGPNLSASAAYMRSRDTSFPDSNDEAEDQSTTFNEPQLTISLKQPVIDLEKASIAVQGVKEMDIADLLHKKAHEDLLLKVHERYYAILSAQEALQLAEKESAALKTQIQNVSQKLELGFGTITDQYDAEARYQVSHATEIVRKTELDNNIKAMEEIIGSPLTEDLEDPAAETSLPEISSDLSHWISMAHRNNTDFKIKELQEQTAHLKYREKQSRFLPALVAFADYNKRHPTDGLLGYGEERSEFDIGIRLEMNLLSGGSDTAATVAAFKKSRSAVEQTKASERAMIRSLRSLWDSLHTTHQLIEAHQLAVEANQRAMASTQEAYEEGLKALLDVLNAQQDYFRAQERYKTTRYDYMMLLERFRLVVGVEKIITKKENQRGGEDELNAQIPLNM